MRTPMVLATLCAAALLLAACGGGGGDAKSSTAAKGGGAASASNGKTGGSVTILQDGPSGSLDPMSSGSVSHAFQADYIVYTPLLTLRHAEGGAGSEIIPGLATALPEISQDGKTYTLQLRDGLTFSDGSPVKASNFAFAVDRAMRMNWPNAQLISKNVLGVGAVLKGKAKHVSGVETDDATGKIVLHLSSPDGNLAAALADPGLAPLPKDTPIKDFGTKAPAGVGAYKITSIVPNQGFTLERNAGFAKLELPGIPTGFVDKIEVKSVTNPTIEAQQVLQNQADVFDAYDAIPATVLPQITAQAKDRFRKVSAPSSYFFAFNVSKPPFDKELVRQAATMALDKSAMVRLAGGFMQPACYLVPDGIPGAAKPPCPHYGDPNGPANLGKAKALVKQAGAVGQAVTIWGINKSPVKEWTHYYASVLNQIGLKAKENILSEGTFWNSIMDPKVSPQAPYGNTSIYDRNPAWEVSLLDGRNIELGQNPVFVNDPTIQRAIIKYQGVSDTEQTPEFVTFWEGINHYIAEKAYFNVFGSLLRPVFTSDRVNFKALVYNVVRGLDWSTLQLK